MRHSYLFALAFLLAGASVAGAQQAPIPAPPTTVHPVPQSPTDCRGCSGTSSVSTPTGGYDEKQPGIIRAEVKPTLRRSVKPAPPHRHKKRHARSHASRRAAARTSVTRAVPDSAKK